MVTKRLVDLYVLGQEVTFEDEGTDPIVVYVKKLQPFEQEIAMSKANVERAKILTLKKLPRDHEDVIPFEMQIDDNFTEEEIVTFVAADDIAKAYRSTESRLSEEEEWAKDDYLSGLKESWVALEEHFISEEYPDQHKDAQRVFAELKKFSDEVDTAFEKERIRIVREYSAKPEGETHAAATEKLIEMKADMKWLEEYRRSQVWLSVREISDKSKKYFANRAEVDDVHPTVLQRLIDTYDEISVRPEEGKG